MPSAKHLQGSILGLVLNNLDVTEAKHVDKG
jgi:hypothetical protein